MYDDPVRDDLGLAQRGVTVSCIPPSESNHQEYEQFDPVHGEILSSRWSSSKEGYAQIVVIDKSSELHLFSLATTKVVLS